MCVYVSQGRFQNMVNLPAPFFFSKGVQKRGDVLAEVFHDVANLRWKVMVVAQEVAHDVPVPIPTVLFFGPK